MNIIDEKYMQPIDDLPSLTPSEDDFSLSARTTDRKKDAGEPLAPAGTINYERLDLPVIVEKTDEQEINLLGAGVKHLSAVKLTDKLLVLQLHGNDITCMDGLGACPNLQELYLSSNNIANITGVGSAHAHLKILDLSCNQLTTLNGLQGLVSLERLIVPFNKIASLDALNVFWGDVSKLETIDLRDNCVSELQELSALRGISNLKDIKFSN